MGKTFLILLHCYHILGIEAGAKLEGIPFKNQTCGGMKSVPSVHTPLFAVSGGAEGGGGAVDWSESW
jgi:hypothetical protein